MKFASWVARAGQGRQVAGQELDARQAQAVVEVGEGELVGRAWIAEPIVVAHSCERARIALPSGALTFVPIECESSGFETPPTRPGPTVNDDANGSSSYSTQKIANASSSYSIYSFTLSSTSPTECRDLLARSFQDARA